MLLHWFAFAAFVLQSAGASYQRNFDKAVNVNLKRRHLTRDEYHNAINKNRRHWFRAYKRADGSNPAADSCGQLTQIAQNATDTGMVPASLTYDCLMTIPFHQQEAIALMDSLRPFIAMHCDMPWVADPPAEYAEKVKAPYDFMACFEKVYQAAQSGSYTSEYLFSLDLEQCWVDMQDQLFGFEFDMAAGIFYFGKTYGITFASPDGTAPPAFYLTSEANGTLNNDASFTPSPIVQINGEDAMQVILKTAQGAPFQDPDAAFNRATDSLFDTGLFTFGDPLLAFYPGPSTTYLFENGTTLEDDTQAFFQSPFPSNISVQTGEDFYQAYIAQSPGCTAAGVGLVSIYEASLCEKSMGSNGTSSSSSTTNFPDAPIPVVPGYPDPVASLDNGFMWGFFLEGEEYKDVAVLAVATMRATYPDFSHGEIANQTLAKFLGHFFQKATKANRTKLIIDVSSNKGGYDAAPSLLFKWIFPALEPKYGGNVLATEAINLMGQEYSYTIDHVPYNDLQYMSKYVAYYYGYDVDVDGNHFTSWDQKFGPVSQGPDGSPFTPYWAMDPQYDGFDLIDKYTQSPFTPNNTVLLSDGFCDSACAALAEMLIIDGGIQTVAYGGRPGLNPMQAVGAARGYQSGTFLDIWHDVFPVFLEPHLHTPEYYNNSVLGAFNTLPLLRSTASGISRQLSQDPRDPNGIPLQYQYQPADYRLQATFANKFSMTQRWQEVVDLVGASFG